MLVPDVDSSIIGPALGGALADPCRNYPTIFARGTLFDRFPYLLPNLICTIILACGVIIGILFLEETHQEKKFRKDCGLEAGRWLSGWLQRQTGHDHATFSKASEANLPESRSLLDEVDDPPPDYQSTESSPRPSFSDVSREETTKVSSAKSSNPRPSKTRPPKPSVQKAFTKQVILNIVGYGLLA